MHSSLRLSSCLLRLELIYPCRCGLCFSFSFVLLFVIVDELSLNPCLWLCLSVHGVASGLFVFPLLKASSFSPYSRLSVLLTTWFLCFLWLSSTSRNFSGLVLLFPLIPLPLNISFCLLLVDRYDLWIPVFILLSWFYSVLWVFRTLLELHNLVPGWPLKSLGLGHVLFLVLRIFLWLLASRIFNTVLPSCQCSCRYTYFQLLFLDHSLLWLGWWSPIVFLTIFLRLPGSLPLGLVAWMQLWTPLLFLRECPLALPFVFLLFSQYLLLFSWSFRFVPPLSLSGTIVFWALLAFIKSDRLCRSFPNLVLGFC